MAQILKPSNLSLTWASGGDVLNPGDTKYATGWQVEIPPRQWFNYLDNRQDEAIAHINQHGIAVWDDATEYQASKSYAQGDDGFIYKSLTTNTNIDPTTDGGTNWTLVATLPLASSAQAQGWSDTGSLLSPSLLNLSFKGANQSFTVNGFQKIAGGLVKQWGVSPQATVGAGAVSVRNITFPIAFPTQVLSLVASPSVTATGVSASLVFNSFTATSAVLTVVNNSGIAQDIGVYYQVVGN